MSDQNPDQNTSQTGTHNDNTAQTPPPSSGEFSHQPSSQIPLQPPVPASEQPRQSPLPNNPHAVDQPLPHNNNAPIPSHPTQPIGTPQNQQYYQPNQNGYQQYPYPEYNQQQPYYAPYPQSPQQPPRTKAKVWPWVLIGCILVGILGLGGCVGCVALSAAVLDRSDIDAIHRYDSRDYSYDYGYNHDKDSGSNNGNGSGSGSGADALSTSPTRDDIMANKDNYDNKIQDGKATRGIYEIGANKDLEAGLYFLEGSQTEESAYELYEKNDRGTYDLVAPVVYFGNYFVELEKDDIIVFGGSESALMYKADKAEFTPIAPFQSGLYRVGTDIPAGTYTLTSKTEALLDTTAQPAAFVMKDLDFDTDSITGSLYVIAGGKHSVTVKQGDWLELYAVTLTATE